MNNLFLNHLLQHQINVYELSSSFSQDGKKFEPGSAYVVPLRQSQFRVLQSIFEENETNRFTDSTTFYDISAWSTVHGFGIPFIKVKASVKEGAQVTQVPAICGSVIARSELAYAFDYYDYLAPKVLYYLQDQGVKVRVAQRPFTSQTSAGNKSFAAGSIVIPVAYQTVTSDELYKLLGEAVKLANVKVHAVSNGFSIAGIDLGSNNVRVLKKPVVAALAGGNWTSIGELSALLGNTLGIPLVKITPQSAERADLSKYTAIIHSGGQLSPELAKRLTDWVDNGGTLIALSGAAQWASSLVSSSPESGFGGGRVVRGSVADAPVPAAGGPASGSPVGSPSGRNAAASVAPAEPQRGGGASRLNGIIVRAELNLSHPLAYGFTSKEFYTLKNSVSGLSQTGADNVVLKTTTGELVNGYANAKALSEIKDKVIIANASRGRGSIVIFGESPTFRGYFLAPGRILTNAVFFGGGGRGFNIPTGAEEE